MFDFFSRPYLVRSRLRAYATVLRLSVCRLSVRNVLCLNGAPYSKSYYWKPIGSCIWEIDWYQSEWRSPLFRGHIKVMSTTALHSTWIFWKPLEMEAWFQSKGPPIGNGLRRIKWSRDRWRHVSTWPWKVKLVTTIRLERNISKTAGDAI